MIEGNQQPLSIAARILQPATLDAVRNLSDYSLRGWRILDRWAFNTPDALCRLETKGELVLLSRLLDQQRLEQQAIDQQQAGTDEVDALKIAEIQTELGAPRG